MKRRNYSAKSSLLVPIVIASVIVLGVIGLKQWKEYKKTPVFLSQEWVTYTPKEREYSFAYPRPLVTLGYNDFSSVIPIDGVIYSDLTGFYRILADAQANQTCLEENVLNATGGKKQAQTPLNVHHVNCPDDFALSVNVVKIPKNNRAPYDSYMEEKDIFKRLGKSYIFVDEKNREWNITEYNTMYDKKPFGEICYRTYAELKNIDGNYVYIVNLETEIDKLERYLGYSVTDGKHPTASSEETVIPEHKLLVNEVLSSMKFTN